MLLTLLTSTMLGTAILNAQTPPAAASLTKSCSLLAQGDYDYRGHRAEAFHHVEVALRELGIPFHAEQRRHHIPQAQSDSDLRQARALLEASQSSLSGKPLQHVRRAIEQIDEALTIR